MNRPVMELVLGLLKQHKLADIIVSLGHEPEPIISYFGSGVELGLNLNYCQGASFVDLDSGLGELEEVLKSTFLVIDSDLVTNYDLESLINFHYEKKALATLALAEVADPSDHYEVALDPQTGRVLSYSLGQPRGPNGARHLVSAKIFVFEPEILQYTTQICDENVIKQMVPLLLNSKAAGRVYGYFSPSYWYAMVNHHQYRQVHYDALRGQLKIDIPGERLWKDVWIGEGATLDFPLVIKGPAVIGKNCRIGRNAAIGSFTILGNGTVVDDEAQIEHSILWDNAYAGWRSRVRGSTVGVGCRVGDFDALNHQAAVGKNGSLQGRNISQPAYSLIKRFLHRRRSAPNSR